MCRCENCVRSDEGMSEGINRAEMRVHRAWMRGDESGDDGIGCLLST